MAAPRQIRSFVRRDSRMTQAQRSALEQHRDRYVLNGDPSATAIRCAFRSAAPISLEIGCGDGACLIHVASRACDENFLGVEVYKPGLGRLMHQANARGLSNVRLFDDDVCRLLESVREPVFDRVFIFFPDPWPKKRHHKRRLIDGDFLKLLRPSIQRHGRVFIATDNADYAESIEQNVDVSEHWINLGGERRRCPRPRLRTVTRFERRAIAAGSDVHEFALAPR